MIDSVPSIVAQSGTQLPILLSQIRRAIVVAESLEECVSLRRRVSALSKIVKTAKAALEQVNEVAIANLEAERKAGRMLKELRLAGGSRRGKSRDNHPTLKSLGIEPNESSRWQRLADVPEEDFRQYVESKTESGQVVSSIGLLRAWKRLHPRNKTSGCGKHSTRSAGSATLGSEVLCELQNHRQTIASLLEVDSKPANGKLVLPVSDAHYVAKLLGEMEGHLRRLEEVLARGQCGTPRPCKDRIT